MRLVPITCVLVGIMLGSDAALVMAASTTNVALASAGGVATANANPATQALVNDGDTATQGWVVPTSAATIKVDWGTSKPVDQVTAIFANANSKTFKFQYWNGSGWVDISSTYTSNTQTTVSFPLPSPVSTVAVRLSFTSAAASVYVNELQAFANNVAIASAGGVATASTNTSTQNLVNDGNTVAQGWVVATGASTIKVDWGSSKPINQVTAIFANANSKTFKFQYWNGSGWVDLSTTYTSNTATTVTYLPPSSVSTVAVRLNFTSAAASVFVNELQAFADSAPAGPTFTVMQFNTHHGGWSCNALISSGPTCPSSPGSYPAGSYNPERIVDVIVGKNPDIVALEEIERNDQWAPTSYTPPAPCTATSDQVALYKCILEAKTGQTWNAYFVLGSNGAANGTPGIGNLVLSRYPFAETQTHALPHGRAVATVRITVNNRNITFMATHLDSSVAANRVDEVNELQTWDDGFAEDKLVLGDFNAGPSTPEVQDFVADYHDEYADCTAANGCTRSGFSGGITHSTGSRIDYVFYSRGGTFLSLTNLETVDTGASGTDPSDHRPVVATYTVR